MKSSILVFSLILFYFTCFNSALDYDVTSVVTVDNVTIINQRDWTVREFPNNNGFFAKGVSITKIPGFTSVDAMALGFTLWHQTALGVGWYRSETDVDISSGNETTITVDFNSAAFGFVVRILGIVDYLDNNGIPGFQLNDTILSTYYRPLNSLNASADWNVDIRNETISDNSNGTVLIHVITLSTVDGVFAIQMVIGPRPLRMNNRPFDQDGVKISVEINWSNFSGKSLNPDAKIALICIVAAAGERTSIDGSVTFPGDNTVGGFLNWESVFSGSNDGNTGDMTTRTVDAQFVESYSNGLDVIDINGSFVAGWGISSVAFTFGLNETRPLHLVWDPEAGASINYPSPPTGSLTPQGSSQPTTVTNTPTSSPISSMNSNGNNLVIIFNFIILISLLFVSL